MKYFQNRFSRQMKKILATENLQKIEALRGSKSWVLNFLKLESSDLI